MLIIHRYYLAMTILVASLGGCATNADKPVACTAPEVLAEPVPSRSPGDVQKINDLERQLAREQRQCLADKRRLEQSLKDAQKQSEDLQKKIDALLAIDHDLRNRSKNR
jgi:hypothetical protein